MKPDPAQAMSEIDLSARLDLFPLTTKVDPHSRLNIAACSLEALAEQYGTPLYLYDRHTLDSAVEIYRNALARFYPGQADITYAGKAYLCTAIAQWTQLHDLWLDCTGAGELRIAAEAKVSRSHVLVHGVNKSQFDLETAMEQAGTLVVDNLVELERVRLLIQRVSEFPQLWLRLRPGMAVQTHSYRQTGQQGSKFGMSAEEARQAVQICLDEDLPLTGLHFHLGSHFSDPEPLRQAIEVSLDLVASLYASTGWLPQNLCPGGGWGLAYHETELPHPDVALYVQFISEQIVAGCQAHRLPLPHLVLEPGRSLVARAGVAVYKVGTVKQSQNRRWLLLDGGMVDNPRPALYSARYSALPVTAPGRPSAGPAWLAGPYCESGDILIEALPMPEIQAEELVAIPVSGAYHLSMGSNYNGALKPAVLLLEAGHAQVIQRRESLDDLVRRDVPI